MNKFITDLEKVNRSITDVEGKKLFDIFEQASHQERIDMWSHLTCKGVENLALIKSVHAVLKDLVLESAKFLIESGRVKISEPNE